MKAIKLIVIFVVILGGVVGAFFLLTDGEKDVPAPSSDTNVLPDTTAIGDTAIIEDVTDEDNRITDPLDEEEVMLPTQKSRPKQKAGANPSKSKQGENTASQTTPQSPTFECPYEGCKRKGCSLRFDTKRALEDHMLTIHKAL